jgi:hypothetical protein
MQHVKRRRLQKLHRHSLAEAGLRLSGEVPTESRKDLSKTSQGFRDLLDKRKVALKNLTQHRFFDANNLTEHELTAFRQSLGFGNGRPSKLASHLTDSAKQRTRTEFLKYRDIAGGHQTPDHELVVQEQPPVEHILYKAGADERTLAKRKSQEVGCRTQHPGGSELRDVTIPARPDTSGEQSPGFFLT